MKVLYVTGGVTGIRHLQWEQGSIQVPVMDEVMGERIYRGQPRSRGVIVVESVAHALALLATEPANLTFTVANDAGSSTYPITVKGFKATHLIGEAGDGMSDGMVSGYVVGWVGEPATNDTAVSSVYHGT